MAKLGRKAKNYLIELLLVFFIIANFLTFGVAQGYYGTNTLFVIRVMPNDRGTAASKIKTMGSEWAREEFNWQTLNPRRGRYDLANADQAVATYRRNGVKVLGMLAYSSLWGSSNTRAGANAQFYKPNINDWKNYVSVIVRRYGNYVKDWEIWNEPDAMWRPSPSADEYREILVAAYDTIKSIDPGAKVGTGGLAYFDTSFLSSVLDNGGWEHCDAVSVHYYPGAGPESIPGDTLRGNLQDWVYNQLIPRGGGKEIWITEIGWQSNQIGLQAQADVTSRSLILARMTNEVTKIIFYNLRDEGNNSYGLMRNNFTPKPSYNSYQKTVQYLGSKRISQWFDLDNSSKFYIFNDSGGGVAAAWNPDRNQITGFHVNASGMHCYDMNDRDISSSVILAWNNGDTTLSFGPTPIFCKLDNYYLAENKTENQALPQVAGVSANNVSGPNRENGSTVSGEIKSPLGKINSGKILAYRQENGSWQKTAEQSDLSNFNLKLNEGKYYLVFNAPGYLSAKTAPFEVGGDGDVSFSGTLLYCWVSYALLFGAGVCIILLVIKYSRKKRR